MWAATAIRPGPQNVFSYVVHARGQRLLFAIAEKCECSCEGNESPSQDSDDEFLFCGPVSHLEEPEAKCS